MNMPTSRVTTGKRLSQPIAIGMVFLLWLSYTAIQTLTVTGHIPDAMSAVLSLVPGIFGILVLAAAGLAREQLFLRMAPLSWKGFLVLAGIFLFALSAILPFGAWRGWNWMAALVYAPASGVAQELFFRSALLPAFLLILKERSSLALLLHALLFGLWHIGPLFVGAPIWAVLAVMLVPFVSGIGWGWQVMHDRTVYWAMVQHTLIWVIAGQFPMPT